MFNAIPARCFLLTRGKDDGRNEWSNLRCQRSSKNVCERDGRPLKEVAEKTCTHAHSAHRNTNAVEATAGRSQ